MFLGFTNTQAEEVKNAIMHLTSAALEYSDQTLVSKQQQVRTAFISEIKVHVSPFFVEYRLYRDTQYSSSLLKTNKCCRSLPEFVRT